MTETAGMVGIADAAVGTVTTAAAADDETVVDNKD
jgi:hypothetical protein